MRHPTGVLQLLVVVALLVTAGYGLAGPVPDTGQTLCYDDLGNQIACPQRGEPFYGQDGNYSISPPSYTKLDAQGNDLPESATSWVQVRDNVTGLIWEVKTDDGSIHDKDNTYTWYDSNPATNGGDPGTAGNGTDTDDFIRALNGARFGGASDWRLPTIEELETIVHLGRTYPSIDTAFFPNTRENGYSEHSVDGDDGAYYWSSTTLASDTTAGWAMDFLAGCDVGGYKDNVAFVRAVRGGQTQHSLVDNGDGTVSDTSTGLMWQQATAPGTYTWAQALAYCESLTLAGHADWRLPTRKELRSIVHFRRYEPSIDRAFFPDTQSSAYLSSTTVVDKPAIAFYISFGNGYDKFSDNKSHPFFIRAVRGGQSGALPSLNSVTIDGPGEVRENSTGNYSLTAVYSDESSETVTNGASWSVDSPYASIDSDGTLTVLSVISDQTATITATYGGLSATHAVTIQNSFLHEPERIMPVAVYRFEEGETPTGSVDLGEGVTLTISGVVEVGILDNHLGFYLGQKPEQASAIRTQTAAAGNLSFTFEQPIQAFTVLAADFDGNTTISAYDASGQVIDSNQVSGATPQTYALTWNQPVAKIVISGTSGWVGTVEELARIIGQILSQADSSPIQSVTVSTSPSNRQGVSDASGNYTVTGVKPGTYTLTGTGTNIETFTVTGIAVSAGATVTQNLTATQGGGTDPAAGYAVTDQLWAKAVLEVSGSPVALVWQEVGADLTPSGDQVISGYFYADPADFAYGSPYNPELFVKIYIAAGGWCNMAFNHVTVDPVTVFSAHQYAGTANQTGSATLQGRLIEHAYTGVAIDTTKQSTGGASGTAGGAGYSLGSNLWSNAVLQVSGNPVNLVWKQVGTDTTPSGAKVVSGYFYADPADFAYGSPYNPEVFVKVYIDPTGWTNLAFNHVTVDPVSIESAHGYAGNAQQNGSATLGGRLLQHEYTGVPVQ